MYLSHKLSFFILITAMLYCNALWASNIDSRPNILLIMADDLGYADVGFNGSTDIMTPSLDKLARNGATFSSAYVAHPFCGPSRAALLTGRHPHKFGSQFNLPDLGMSGGKGIPIEEEFMSNILQKSGYFTGAIGKWHLGETEEFHPNNRGFDEFYGFLGGGHDYFPKKYQETVRQQRAQGQTNIFHYLLPLQYNGKTVQETEYLTDAFSREAVRFIDKSDKQKKPFFLYLAYNAPHTPLQAKQSDMDKFSSITDQKRKTYAGMVYAIDRGVQRVVDALKRTDQYDNTIIIFLSDNGGRPDQGASNSPLREGKGSVNEGGFRTPMLIHWPQQVKAGTRFKHLVSALDFYPTLTGLAKAVVPENKILDGKDIWSDFLAGTNPHKGEAFFVMRHRYGYSDVAIIQDQWKAIRKKNQRWKLFNIQTDTGESTDLSAKNPRIVRNLVSKMEQWSWTNEQPRWFHKHQEGYEWREKSMPRFHETFRIE